MTHDFAVSRRKSRTSAWLLTLLFLTAVSCDVPGTDAPQVDVPCSCTVGTKRCTGSQIQVCEATTASCPTWGPASACPSGSCSGDSCTGSTCSDGCSGGLSRCATDTDSEICRIGPSGCLEWVKQACSGNTYCGGTSCQPALRCEPTCPSDYLCKPTGTCAGGNPLGLVLNVQTVKLSGKVTLNGALPIPEATCTTNPSYVTSRIRLTEITKGYSFSFATTCKDNDFAFAGEVFPGTYRVTVDGTNAYSSLPAAAFVTDAALVVAADKSGVVLDVKTVKLSGSVTLNGAAPMPEPTCTTNPTYVTSRIRLTEVTNGYSFTLSTLCKDSGFPFSAQIFPGTYRITVDGTNAYSSLPNAAYVAESALSIPAEKSGVILNVRTVQLAGKVTLNGAAPTPEMTCTANPTYVTSRIRLTDAANGYSFTFSTLCKDNTFAFAGPVFPGTYRITVDGTNAYSNVPNAAYVAESALTLSADKSDLLLNVQTLQLSGKVTLNGAVPQVDTYCMTNPTAITSRVRLTDAARGYSFTLNTLCKDAAFPFAGVVFPGSYRVVVDGTSTYSNVPNGAFVADPALALSADKSGLLLDVKTVQVSGKITLNGAAPTPTATYCPTNPTAVTGHVRLIEATKGYTYSLNTLCKDAGFGFSGTIFPGTYQVTVDGQNTYSDIPDPSFIARTGVLIDKDTTDLILDVKTVLIAGKLLLNGVLPMLDAYCTANPTTFTATLRFTELQSGVTTTLKTLCKDATFSFAASIYPGTYRITVDGTNTYSNIPTGAFVAISRITLP